MNKYLLMLKFSVEILWELIYRCFPIVLTSVASLYVAITTYIYPISLIGVFCLLLISIFLILFFEDKMAVHKKYPG